MSLGTLPSAHPHIVSGPLTPPLYAQPQSPTGLGPSAASPSTPGAASGIGFGPSGLRIDVAAANDPAAEVEMVDASFVAPDAVPALDVDEMCFDDEGLSALEKVYLYARSSAPFHRCVSNLPISRVTSLLTNFALAVRAVDALRIEFQLFPTFRPAGCLLRVHCRRFCPISPPKRRSSMSFPS